MKVHKVKVSIPSLVDTMMYHRGFWVFVILLNITFSLLPLFELAVK